MSTTRTASSAKSVWISAKWVYRHPHSSSIWGLLDSLGHMLRLPRFIQRRLCNRFDRALGVEP